MMISPGSIKVLDTVLFSEEKSLEDEEEEADPDEPIVENRESLAIVCLRDTQMFVN